MTSPGATPTADDGPADAPGEGGSTGGGGSSDAGDDRPVVERMVLLLARRMAAAGHAPRDTISVAELRGELLPYPLSRESLELASKAEYDLALLRLLHDPAYLEIGDPDLSEAVEEELSGPEPGLAFLGEFTESPLRPSGTAAVPPEPDAEPPATREPADAAFLSELADEPPERDLAPSGSSVTCRSCGRSLPERPDARYCPYCGSDQRSLRCEGCDTDLEAGWRYCPSCGHPAHPSGPA